MAEFDRSAANMQMLNKMDGVQDKTLASLARTARQVAETEEVGIKTIEELRRQKHQQEDIIGELDSVGAKLDTSRQLQSKFDLWTGNWLGGKRRQAMAEASQEIAKNSEREHTRVKEVFQNETYDQLFRTWKRAGLVLAADCSVACEDLFDPEVVANNPQSRWNIDYSLPSVDGDGWTYGGSVAALQRVGQKGEAEAKWNSFGRRRKWVYTDPESKLFSAVNGVQSRVEERRAAANKGNAANKAAGSSATAARSMQSSGMSSAMGAPAVSQELDEDATNGMNRGREKNAMIDAGIDAISSGLDKLGNLSTAIADEVKDSTARLDKMDRGMQRTTEKQTIVNARQRYLLG